ncbi:uncharacterized protein LOC130985925 [Salvia miltiorrhiza]|uniref:uncharacterized protein LOC130985925 n=1 Tax=Salvia miltiorrhiza TaxID=226208 RepID=UPI0025ABCFCC|nr:uncharacterized protein LOC130985925 [Salvia miltiorrhiza]
MTNYLLIPIFIFILLQRPVLGSWDLLSELSGREELVQWAGYGEDKLSTVVITGTILCNAADLPSINTHPVSGARVSVMCGSGTKKKWSTAKGSTDVSGKFAIDLPSHLHAIPNLERVCHVRVVHLPLTSPCRKACAAKHNKAIALSSVDQGIRTYTTHNIHLNRI